MRTCGARRCARHRAAATATDPYARTGVRPLHRTAGEGIRITCSRWWILMDPASSLNWRPARVTARQQPGRASQAGGTNPIGLMPSFRSRCRPDAMRSAAAVSLSVTNSPSCAVCPQARQASRQLRDSPCSSWRSPCRNSSAPRSAQVRTQRTNAGAASSGALPCQFGTTSKAGVIPRAWQSSHSSRTRSSSGGATS